MLRSIVFGLGVALIGLQADPTSAQQVCGERIKLMTQLGEKYAEACLVNLAAIYLGLGNDAEAEKLYMRALAIWENAPTG